MSKNSYNIYRIDRNSRGGGVAIYVKDYFNMSVLFSFTVPKCFEIIALKIEYGSKASIVVVEVYRLPSADYCALTKQEDLLSICSFRNYYPR